MENPKSSSLLKRLLITIGLPAALATVGISQGIPTLVSDLNPTPSSTPTQYPWQFVSNGQYVLFVSNDTSGDELWGTDGSQTTRLADLNPGPSSSSPGWITKLGQSFVFTADDGLHGREIWRISPPAAPVLLQDIAVGSSSSDPAALTLAGNYVFFFATEANGRRSLWKTDGTIGGTTKVHDASSVATGASYSGSMTALGTRVFYEANDTLSGWEPYASDGTAAGTAKITDLVPGNNAYNPVVNRGVLQGSLVFTRNPEPGIHSDVQFWRTDGTAAGTVQYAAINTLFDTLQSGPMVCTSDRGFVAGTSLSMFVTDGTALWMTTGLSTYPGKVVVSHDKAFHWSDPSLSFYYGLWATNSAGSTQLIVVPLAAGVQPPSGQPWWRGVVWTGSHYLFQVWNTATGYELWRSDGTQAGTVMVRDILPGPGSSFAMGPFELADAAVLSNGNVVFGADDGVHGYEAWISDGTYSGTRRLADPVPASSQPVFAEDRLGNAQTLFAATTATAGRELWRSNSTAAGTALVTDLYAGALGSNPTDFAAFDNGVMVFLADDGLNGRQLFRSDGSAAGTIRLTQGSSHSNLRRSGDIVYFSMNGGNGDEPWRTDGTLAGTFELRDILSGGQSSSPDGFADANGVVYFAARAPNSGIGNRRLWRSDGTTAGTVQVSSVNMSPTDITWMNGNLWFVGSDGQGTELWRYTGSGAPARFVDINPGAGSSTPQGLLASGNRLFFTADDGVSGRELWVTDGTQAGTVRVADLTAGAGGSTIVNPCAFHGGLLFGFNDGVHGLEPWFSDGTTAGTILLADVNPGTSSSLGSFLWSLQGAGRALFAADDGVHGMELWRTDGTPAGTVLHADVNLGGSGNPERPVLVGSTLMMAIDDGLTGKEPWAAAAMACGLQYGHGCGPDPMRMPRLWSPDVPLLGHAGYRFQLDFGGAGVPAYLGFDFATYPISIGSGCNLYLPGGVYAALLTDASGGFTVPLPLPSAPWLKGFAVYFQALLMDPAGPYPGGWSTSNGFKIILSDA